MRKKVSILGSTGSIGKNTLKVATHLKEKIEIVALAAGSNIDLLEKQALEFKPKLVAVADKEKALQLQKRLPHLRVVGGIEGLCEAAANTDADVVVSALLGAAGLIPTAAAIEAGKTIALANKETLVAGGSYIMPLSKKHGVKLIPVDSEHSAVFQCLHREQPSAVRRIVLTSSGGPFRGRTKEDLQKITLEDALKHPNFSMGAKITIDSSTLMNKGLEVIEAYWLFGVSIEQVEVIIHPQQKIHSMVEFVDGSILAQMSEPDMLIPIQYALTYPERVQGLLKPYNFAQAMDFFEPDLKNFSCLRLAYESLKTGGSLPCYMNAANEVLVARFMNREINWLSISEKLEKLMSAHKVTKDLSLEAILSIDQMAREEALTI